VGLADYNQIKPFLMSELALRRPRIEKRRNSKGLEKNSIIIGQGRFGNDPLRHSPRMGQGQGVIEIYAVSFGQWNLFLGLN
jgi:hypothetical protein